MPTVTVTAQENEPLSLNEQCRVVLPAKLEHPPRTVKKANNKFLINYYWISSFYRS